MFTNIGEFLPFILEGLSTTVQAFLFGAALAYSIAIVAGLARTSKLAIVRVVATIFVELFRGTSLLVQMFFFAFVFPSLAPFTISTFLAGGLALGFNYGAYASEVVRGAVLSVPKGQTEAAISLNMSKFQRMRLVILPQAFRIMLPGIGNNSIELLKGTSLVYFISLADMTYRADILRGANTALSSQVEIYTYLLLTYFVIALPLVLLTRWLEKQASKGVSTA
ncbi:ectoine/hydroxyectoine ABC transporter permease subunit EhuC [Salicibibacter cibi]|uniref:Ectoine/hydroxyectoine ABC transporter permease subunit EhuC n=1 Tax=Salicibibacter cibi TaxID=2743001 RepID=A0A7T6Z9P6_9BACI|nr:ectoine/hydroxyectoine ABC transporter permease subunit EhuC [Salicibibacter cibi]QQK79416.1 ectoine/hydroxyectoine ABC transporter permease subunit EhuC [Salicibibacter cibi]